MGDTWQSRSLGRPTTRDELLARIDSDYDALLIQVSAVDPSDRERPGACQQSSVKDLLAHLDAWHELFLTWERIGRAGDRPEMPGGQVHMEADTRTQRADLATPTMTAGKMCEHGSKSRTIECATSSRRTATKAMFAKRRFAWTGGYIRRQL